MGAPGGFRDLRVYQLAYQLAMQIFKETKAFPPHERYSMTSQIRRCSRSVAANLAEGYRKRRYPNMFVSKLADCDGEATETQVWLDFARDCGYLSKERHKELAAGYDEIGRMLSSMIANPEKFAPTQNAVGSKQSALRTPGLLSADCRLLTADRRPPTTMSHSPQPTAAPRRDC
jgi:four helix bundle protein